MKKYFYVGFILFSVSGFFNHAYGESNTRPFCYDVNVQINPENQANVKQNCQQNYSRTSQAGNSNSAYTEQKGNDNSNSVRQYQYNASPRISPQKR